MPRKRDDEVLVDPVAAAAQLGHQHAPEPLASMTGPDAETERGRSLPWSDPEHNVLADVRDAMQAPDGFGPNDVPVVKSGARPKIAVASLRDAEVAGSSCALGHGNDPSASFCASCGLSMSAQAPPAAAEAARPKPASQLSPEERSERDRQHLEAMAAARQFEAQQPSFVPPEGETVLIHFIEDGLTFAGQVWYRGQEIEIGPAHPRWEQVRGWILLDRYAQVERYGKQYFAPGPWPGRRSYLDGINNFQRLSGGKDADGNPVTFAGPGEQALRQADEAERRRGRSVPGMVLR